MSEKRSYYFVVYGAKVGRTEPGIYHRQVTFDGDLAFVHPKEDAKTADIVPAANVFKEKKQAEECIAKGGVVRWCVYIGSRDRVPELFQARVRYHVSERFSGRRWPHTLTAHRLDNGDVITDTWGFKTFLTKKEAEKEYRFRWNETKKEIDQKLDELFAKRDRLEENKPRSGKKKKVTP